MHRDSSRVWLQGKEVDDVPSAVSDSAGWRETLRVKHMRDKKCDEEGFKVYDIATIVGAKDVQGAQYQPLQGLL